MFEAECRLHGASHPLRRIAIVDDDPGSQYLHPEFILARQILARAGYNVVIAAPEALSFSDGLLLHEGGVVDLVYNRLVDFALERPGHEGLRHAFERRAVALTPNPHNHALFADKHNLTVLSDPAVLAELGASSQQQEVLEAIPRTVVVHPDNAA